MRSGHYDWDDLRRLIRATDRVDADKVLTTIESRYGSLRKLSDLERLVDTDARSGRNDPLAERLRADIRLLMKSARDEASREQLSSPCGPPANMVSGSLAAASSHSRRAFSRAACSGC